MVAVLLDDKAAEKLTIKLVVEMVCVLTTPMVRTVSGVVVPSSAVPPISMVASTKEGAAGRGTVPSTKLIVAVVMEPSPLMTLVPMMGWLCGRVNQPLVPAVLRTTASLPLVTVGAPVRVVVKPLAPVTAPAWVV